MKSFVPMKVKTHKLEWSKNGKPFDFDAKCKRPGGALSTGWKGVNCKACLDKRSKK